EQHKQIDRQSQQHWRLTCYQTSRDYSAEEEPEPTWIINRQFCKCMKDMAGMARLKLATSAVTDQANNSVSKELQARNAVSSLAGTASRIHILPSATRPDHNKVHALSNAGEKRALLAWLVVALAIVEGRWNFILTVLPAQPSHR